MLGPSVIEIHRTLVKFVSYLNKMQVFVKKYQLPDNSKFDAPQNQSKPSEPARTAKPSSILFSITPALASTTLLISVGETKRKFESVHSGGTMNTPDSGKVLQYWHCCGSEDPFDPGCTAAPHSSYDD
ncbi:unnamed protein product [Camellia sinensis]